MSEEAYNVTPTEPRILVDKETALQLLESLRRRAQVAVTLDDPLGLATRSWVGPWLRDLFPRAHVQHSGTQETQYELRKEEWSDAWTALEQDSTSPSVCVFASKCAPIGNTDFRLRIQRYTHSITITLVGEHVAEFPASTHRTTHGLKIKLRHGPRTA